MWQGTSQGIVAGRSRQQGAVLLFSLIILLLLTMLGLTAIQTTAMQERMAGGMRDNHLALQGAEAAIRDGEQLLEQAGLPQFNGSNSLYHHENAPSPHWDDYDWDNARLYRGGDDMDGLLHEPPAYYIEQLPAIQLPGGSLVADDPQAADTMFLIVARSTGASGQADTIVRVIYRRD